jgi:hypothetical protein
MRALPQQHKEDHRAERIRSRNRSGWLAECIAVSAGHKRAGAPIASECALSPKGPGGSAGP